MHMEDQDRLIDVAIASFGLVLKQPLYRAAYNAYNNSLHRHSWRGGLLLAVHGGGTILVLKA